MRLKGCLFGLSVCLALSSTKLAAQPAPMPSAPGYPAMPYVSQPVVPMQPWPGMFGPPYCPPPPGAQAPQRPGQLPDQKKGEELPPPQQREPAKAEETQPEPQRPDFTQAPMLQGMPVAMGQSFASSTGADLGGPPGTAPGMIGPYTNYASTQLIRVQNLVTGEIFPVTVAGAPLASRAQFRIADNESPQPQDRVWLTYNFAHNVNKEALRRLPENAFIVNNRLITNLDLHYETFGLETAFFDNWFSIGFRVPFFQLEEEESGFEEDRMFQIASGLDENSIGDVTIVLKSVIAYDPVSNNLLSGGVAFTAPTAQDVRAYSAFVPAVLQLERSISTWLIQPYLGYFIDVGCFYVHGFTSVVIPTDSDDVAILFGDIGVGYCLYNFFVPTIELHFAKPLNESSDLFREPIGAVDQIIVTAGFHVAFYDACTATLGVATPINGPGTFDVEAIAQLNIRCCNPLKGLVDCVRSCCCKGD